MPEAEKSPPPKSKERTSTHPRKRKKETGSRWAAVALLILTIILSLLVYFRGQISKGSNLKLFDSRPASPSTPRQLQNQPTWTFEK